jgi:hypothetical protein
MTVFPEPFASIYDDRSCPGVILARGRSGFEAYASQPGTIFEPAQSRCRDYYDALVGRPKDRRDRPERSRLTLI